MLSSRSDSRAQGDSVLTSLSMEGATRWTAAVLLAARSREAFGGEHASEFELAGFPLPPLIERRSCRSQIPNFRREIGLPPSSYNRRNAVLVRG